MHSFNLVGIGNLASDPAVQSKGETTFTRFCLMANDAGENVGFDATRQIT